MLKGRQLSKEITLRQSMETQRRVSYSKTIITGHGRGSGFAELCKCPPDMGKIF